MAALGPGPFLMALMMLLAAVDGVDEADEELPGEVTLLSQCTRASFFALLHTMVEGGAFKKK